MRRIGLAFVALVVATAVRAESPRRFNLDCAGTEQRSGQEAEEKVPWSKSFALDLDAAKGWVVGAKLPFEIAVTETTIRLLWEPPSSDPTALAVSDRTEISRTSGDFSQEEHYRMHGEAFFSMYVSARCKLAPYTPIPKNLF